MFVESTTYDKMKLGRDGGFNTAPTPTDFIIRGDEMAQTSLPKSTRRSKIHDALLNEEAFWKKVVKGENPNDCWGWTGKIPTDKFGKPRYVSTHWNGRSVGAHRVSFFLANGYWPSTFVLHSCDNPPCTNPLHLREGTVQDNSDDMVNRGRAARGSGNPFAKLNEDAVKQIRVRIAQGGTNLAIGNEFNVSPWTISLIRVGKTWAHVVKEAGVEEFNDAMVGLQVYGQRVLFTRVRIRKATDCRQCRTSMPKASIAFRPITNRDFRSERVHRECLAEYERTH